MTTDPRVAREMAHLFAACVPQPLTPGQQAILDAVPLREPGPFDIFQSWPTRPDPDPVEEVLGRMAASTSTVSATPPATLAMRQFADAGRRYVARRGRRRMPAQLRMRGPRGRARVLQARRDSLGFVLAAYLAEFNARLSGPQQAEET